ncbi:MAG: hypothetical protein SGPRY_012528 [Prymnesium sp.]
MAARPSSLLSSAVRARRWRADKAQRAAAELLDQLHSSSPPPSPRGLYLWGGVGSGKTALMDMLVESEGRERCTRLHWHELMRMTHASLHAGTSPAQLGASLASSTLVCVDEVSVSDVADAAILSSLLPAVLKAGARIVTTSNLHPSRLYEGGLNRHLYIPPLLDALRQGGVHVHELAGRDYRLGARETRGGLYPSGADGRASLRSAVDAAGGEERGALSFAFGDGRVLQLEQRRGSACMVSFQALCMAPLGPSDYLALAQAFHTMAIAEVPCLSPSQHNEARRFISFCDVWYDAGHTLFLSTQDTLHSIFQSLDEENFGHTAEDEADGKRAAASKAISVRSSGGSSSGWATTYMGDGTEWSATGLVGASLAGLSGVQDVSFARKRALSRLNQMVGAQPRDVNS